MSLRIIIYNVY